MEIYLIIAFSFAIMYMIQYGYQIAVYTLEVLKSLDIDYREYDWNPYIYVGSSLVVAFTLMPAFVFLVLLESRPTVITKAADFILDKHFGVTYK